MEPAAPAQAEPLDAATLQGVGLGLRWSFLDQVLDGEVPASIRFFEVSPENYIGRGGWVVDAVANVADRAPVLTHGLTMNIGSTDPLDKGYLDALRHFLDLVGVSQHSDHLCWTGTEGQDLHDLLPLPARHDVVEHLVDRIRRVQGTLGRPLALENIAYYLDPDPRAAIPEHLWVAEVVERAECQLLLDVNNVWVNAQNHGLDPYEVLRAMPLDRVAHLHVAGGEHSSRFDDMLIDTHGAGVHDEVAQLMEWVVERTGPVPVVYERDHNIPSLDQLGEQATDLQVRYDRAIERWRAAAPSRPPPRARIELPADCPSAPSLNAIQSALARAVLRPSDPVAETDTLLGMPPERVDIYRRLIRTAVADTVRRFMPRTVSRLGEETLQHWLARWLWDVGPRSRFLRELPQEFGAFVRRCWPDDPGIPEYLVDLADHELVEMVVDAANDPRPVAAPGDTTMSLGTRFELTPTTRRVAYRYRVHELSDDPDNFDVPQRADTHLLVYRDAEHEVRYLELTPFGAQFVDRLAVGDELRAAVAHSAEALTESVDDAFLVRAATLLADLADRGIVRAQNPA